mmetsp:Transcript_24268/g.43184  ORF Transcript_24268/g.43184 Transcript_24268/m.43184 type:complete len:436 (+) Transcript_24268:290-1597(+)
MLARRKQLKSAPRSKDPRHERRKSSRRLTGIVKIVENALVRAKSFDGINKAFRKHTASTEPKTGEEGEYTTRLQFHRRKDFCDKLLVIVVFEGVVGDTYKEDLWSEEPPQLHLRPNAINSLKKMSESYQLALVLLSEKTDFSKFDTLCSQEDFSFDAVYLSNNSLRWEKQTCKTTDKMRLKQLEFTKHIQDYNQVYLDFEITYDVLCRVLVLTSIAVDPEELPSKAHADVLYWNGPFDTKKFLVTGVPVTLKYDAQVPVTVLVPNPRSHAHHLAGSFLEIQRLLEHLTIKNHAETWIEAYASHMPDNVRTFCTSLIDFEMAREKPLVTRAQAMSYRSDKRPEVKLPAIPVHDDPVEMTSSYGFKTIVREFKPQRRGVKRVCRCPDDYKPYCISNECRSIKALTGYLLTGAEMPSSYQMHRFIFIPTSPIFRYRAL